MTTGTAALRQQLLDEVAAAADAIATALGQLGDAYEQLDDDTADRLEEVLFRPLQLAYGRIRRTHTEFAERHGLPTRAFRPATSGGGAPRPTGEVLERALESVGEADALLADLQDSMLPVEVGDPTVRAGVAEVRRLLDGLAVPARELTRRLGR
jgi:hypothetical protein